MQRKFDYGDLLAGFNQLKNKSQIQDTQYVQ